MSDVSWVTGLVGGVSGGLIGAVRQQRRIARTLDLPAAGRWSTLGFVGRSRLIRQLQRGRTFENRWDAEMAAQVAAALREYRQRTGVTVAFGLGAIALGVVWVAGREELLGSLLAAVGVFALSSPLWQRRLQRRLARPEQANREVAERAAAVAQRA